MHVSYATHIALLYYIENVSTYVVSRRHLYIAYFTTSLQEHREVKRSRSTKQTPSLSGTFERSHGIFLNTARSKGQKVKVKLVFPRNMSGCIWYCSACCARDIHVLRACCTSEPVQTGSNHLCTVGLRTYNFMYYRSNTYNFMYCRSKDLQLYVF